MPPSFGEHGFKDKLILHAGSSTVIEVPFTASPKPTVKWTYNGGKMPDSRRFKEETISAMTALTITKCVKSDAGDYKLSLENPFGSCVFTLKIIVLGKSDKGSLFAHVLTNIMNCILHKFIKGETLNKYFLISLSVS